MADRTTKPSGTRPVAHSVRSEADETGAFRGLRHHGDVERQGPSADRSTMMTRTNVGRIPGGCSVSTMKELVLYFCFVISPGGFVAAAKLVYPQQLFVVNRSSKGARIAS
jgi:hypothetical protein